MRGKDGQRCLAPFAGAPAEDVMAIDHLAPDRGGVFASNDVDPIGQGPHGHRAHRFGQRWSLRPAVGDHVVDVDAVGQRFVPAPDRIDLQTLRSDPQVIARLGHLGAGPPAALVCVVDQHVGGLPAPADHVQGSLDRDHLMAHAGVGHRRQFLPLVAQGEQLPECFSGRPIRGAGRAAGDVDDAPDAFGSGVVAGLGQGGSIGPVARGGVEDVDGVDGARERSRQAADHEQLRQR